VSDITIVDFDSFEESNQNRQLLSEQHLGEPKVESFLKHYPSIKIINAKIDERWVEEFDFDEFDLVLDAIDNTRAKLAIAQKCYKKLISSFGGAKRLDPTKIEVSDIWKTHGDKFGSKIRHELRKRGFKKKYRVVFSPEETKIKDKGSFMGVTASFGLAMCSEAVKILTK
jgi:tRNA A37 threonylcarbamoyladenosine dehydratase